MLFIIALSVNCFGQNETIDPRDFIDGFLECANENDFERAKTFFHPYSLKNENFTYSNELVKFISDKKLKFEKTLTEDRSNTSAFFHLQLKSQNGREYEIQFLLVKTKEEWKILFFYIETDEIKQMIKNSDSIPKVFKFFIKPQSPEKEPKDYVRHEPCKECV